VDGLVAEALGARRATAEQDLRDALRLDASRLVASEVEARLRARPNFLAAFPASALVQLRTELDAAGPRLADEAWTKLTDLRAWFGAEGSTDADEAAAVARALAPFTEAVLELLRVYGFPDDSAADEPGAPLDLEAEYTVEYRPSPQLEGAWRRLRALDGARNALADGGAGGFDVAFHVPEALPGP
jgi:hypothetical protein